MAIILTALVAANAQTGGKKIDKKPVKRSPAYAEILYRQVSVRSELEDLLTSHTEEYPKVRALRVEEDYLKQEMKRLLETDAADAAHLSMALGKLVVEKVALEIELWNLLQKYSEQHPDVKKARRKITIFENAIKEIL